MKWTHRFPDDYDDRLTDMMRDAHLSLPSEQQYVLIRAKKATSSSTP